MQTPEGQKEKRGNKQGWDRPLESKKSKRWNTEWQQGALDSSPPDHQSVTSVRRLGLGQDVLQVKNMDQYAGHRTGEGKVDERVHGVYCSNFQFPLSDNSTNVTVSFQTQQALTGSHIGLFHWVIMAKPNLWWHKQNQTFHSVNNSIIN